jgi:hypothetical protein
LSAMCSHVMAADYPAGAWSCCRGAWRVTLNSPVRVRKNPDN